MIRASEPRYRLYTRPRDYSGIVGYALAGWSGSDDDCRRLEAEIAERQRIAHAHCMPQNRVGVYFAVKALVRPGRKIIVSAYTLSDVINMVICAGAIPVFADIDRATCNIDPADVERLIDDETDAVMVTHLHGLACEMLRLREICDRHGLKLLEDAAQAFGAVLDQRPTGTFGDAGVYSFGMYKNVNSFYGGMLVTPHGEVDARVRAWMADLPRQPMRQFLTKTLKGLASDIATWPPLFKAATFWIFRHAYLNDIEFFNRQVMIELDPKLKTTMPETYLCRMTPMQARLVSNQLSHVEAFNEARRRAARLYHDGLSDVSELILPPWRDDGSHIYTYYAVQAVEREELLRHMIRHGRDVAVQHLRNCAALDCFRDYARECPEAAATAAQCILLATYPRYSLSEVEKNVQVIRAFYGRV